MPMTKTVQKVFVAIGDGAVTGGDIPKGGIALMCDQSGNFVNIVTSTNGSDIKSLVFLTNQIQGLLDAKLDATATATDSALLNGKTEAELATAVVNTITNGAGTAYDTLLELENEIKANDTDLVTILATQANKVDKVVGSSLLADTEIARLLLLTNISPRTDVRDTATATDDAAVTELGVRTAIEASTPYIWEF